MKITIFFLLLLIGCSWREHAQPMQGTDALPPALAKQILDDPYILAVLQKKRGV